MHWSAGRVRFFNIVILYSSSVMAITKSAKSINAPCAFLFSFAAASKIAAQNGLLFVVLQQLAATLSVVDAATP